MAVFGRKLCMIAPLLAGAAMSARVPLLLLLAALAGCQTSNPYTASHQPYPPAPLDPATARHADPGSYPPATRDFGQYRHWQWAEEVDELLAGIVSAELDQRGLRPGSAQSPATLSLRAYQRSAIRQRQTYDDPYLGAGLGYYHHHYGYWGGMPIPLVRTVTYRVEEVQLDFFDARSGERVWQAVGEAEQSGRGAASADALRRAVRQAPDGFPPP